MDHDAIVEFTALLEESTRQRRQLIDILRRMRRACEARAHLGAPILPARRTVALVPGPPRREESRPASVTGSGHGPATWAQELFPPLDVRRSGRDFDYFRSLDERLRALPAPGGVEHPPGQPRAQEPAGPER